MTAACGWRGSAAGSRAATAGRPSGCPKTPRPARCRCRRRSSPGRGTGRCRGRRRARRRPPRGQRRTPRSRWCRGPGPPRPACTWCRVAGRRGGAGRPGTRRPARGGPPGPRRTGSFTRYWPLPSADGPVNGSANKYVLYARSSPWSTRIRRTYSGPMTNKASARPHRLRVSCVGRCPVASMRQWASSATERGCRRTRLPTMPERRTGAGTDTPPASTGWRLHDTQTAESCSVSPRSQLGAWPAARKAPALGHAGTSASGRLPCRAGLG